MVTMVSGLLSQAAAANYEDPAQATKIIINRLFRGGEVREIYGDSYVISPVTRKL